MVSACSSEPVEDDPGYNSTVIEDTSEKKDILEKAQSAEEDIYSMNSNTRAFQNMFGDQFNEEIVMSVVYTLMRQPLAGSALVDMEALGQNTRFRMHFSEDATYLSNNPDTENERWEKVTGDDHEEIIEDFKEEFSFVNFDVLLEHIDELTFADVDNYESDSEYYEVTFHGESDIYHALINEQNWIDESNQPASVEEFTFTLSLEKGTYHPMSINTEMQGTLDFEGEVIQVSESMFTDISFINVHKDGDLDVPRKIKESVEAAE